MLERGRDVRMYRGKSWNVRVRVRWQIKEDARVFEQAAHIIAASTQLLHTKHHLVAPFLEHFPPEPHERFAYHTNLRHKAPIVARRR